MDKKTEKQLAKLKTTYRKKFKESNDVIKFSRDNDVITINDVPYGYPFQFHLKEKLGVLVVQRVTEGKSYSWTGFPSEPIREKVLEYIESYAKIKKIGVILINTMYNLSLDEKKYQKMKDFYTEEETKAWQMYFDTFISEKTWVKELNKDFHKKVIGFCEKYNEVFKQAKKENPTMLHALTEEPIINEVMSLYYEGYETKIETIYENEVFIIKEGLSGEFKVNGAEELEDVLKNKILKKIRNTQRIRNIADPPKKHFEEFASSYLPKNVKNHVHQVVSTGKNPKETEEFFLNQLSGASNHIQFDLSYYKHVQMLQLSEYIFVYDDNVIYDFKIEDYDKAKTKFDEIILNNIKETIKHKQERFEHGLKNNS